jgi:segregation and condensation protein A
MKQMNLDLAAEYLEMAATLTYIKSKMLLPPDPSADDEIFEEGPDPREELVRRLLEYQKYKTAADDLTARPMLGRDTFPRGACEEMPEDRDLETPGLFALMEAFQKILSRADIDPTHEVSITRISISARIHQLLDVFRTRHRVTFSGLFGDQRTKADMVITFLSILEMVRLGLLKIQQVEDSAEIHVTATSGLAEAEKIMADNIVEE